MKKEKWEVKNHGGNPTTNEGEKYAIFIGRFQPYHQGHISLIMQKINEGIDAEFMGILNYSIIALIQLNKKSTLQPDMGLEDSVVEYKKHSSVIKNLMEQKNHDYGEAWKEMRISSFTDLILQKLHRIKQIEDNDGETIMSEGIDANYHDIVNYSIFALIQLKEKK